MDDSFKKVAVNVPRLSGFDKSHQNLLTTKCGTITPILVDELIPGAKVNLKLALSASLPPLASDTFMRCSVKTEAFFVPFRLLSGSFESWFTDDPKDMAEVDPDDGSVATSTEKGYLPCLEDSSVSGSGSFSVSKMGNGSLADYLGCKSVSNAFLRLNPISLMPFLAYHRVWNDWYRNSLVQKECFLPLSTNALGGALVNVGCLPYMFTDSNNYVFDTDSKLTLIDGHHILDLRQRNFGLDYFTTATPNAQQGSAEVVSMNVSGGSAQFSIAALRAANSMQQFKERNNLLGNLYVEQVFGRYGVRPSDAIAQRSLYLGRGEFEVYSKGIFQTASDSASPNNNPFSSTGARFGNAYASGDSFLVNFEAKEPGYLMVMATLVPRVTYPDGIHRRFTHYVGNGSLADLANPILQNMGPQQIWQYELSSGLGVGTFGFTDRYAEFKTMEDELHGLLRTGQSLQNFALQRSISGSAQINNSFLQIPTNFMDNVTAVTADISTYGVWIDCFFDYKVAQPLSKYSLPTLQDPAYEHGKTLVVSKGGSKL